MRNVRNDGDSPNWGEVDWIQSAIVLRRGVSNNGEVVQGRVREALGFRAGYVRAASRRKSTAAERDGSVKDPTQSENKDRAVKTGSWVELGINQFRGGGGFEGRARIGTGVGIGRIGR